MFAFSIFCLFPSRKLNLKVLKQLFSRIFASLAENVEYFSQFYTHEIL